MKSPLVSVILPSYNYAGTLDEALKSVLAQTFQDFEIIAVDDGSTDESLTVLQRWQKREPERIHVTHRKNGINRGISSTCQDGRSPGPLLLLNDGAVQP